MTSKPSITIVGAGNLGSVLARTLHAAGYRVDEIVSRPGAASVRRASALAKKVRAVPRTIATAELTSSIIWLTVSDDAIASTARSLAARRDWRGQIALHSSGALSSDMLESMSQRGASIATLHPMQSFVRSSPAGMRGIWFGLEGDARAVRVAKGIAIDLGGHVLPIRKANKALYHALGSFVSPMLVAVLALAGQIAREAGIPKSAQRGVMEPILRRTLENYLRRGPAAAFSGPLIRGDATTIRAHLAALGRVPGALDVYKALVRSALKTLPVGNRAAIAKLVR